MGQRSESLRSRSTVQRAGADPRRAVFAFRASSSAPAIDQSRLKRRLHFVVLSLAPGTRAGDRTLYSASLPPLRRMEVVSSNDPILSDRRRDHVRTGHAIYSARGSLVDLASDFEKGSARRPGTFDCSIETSNRDPACSAASVLSPESLCRLLT